MGVAYIPVARPGEIEPGQKKSVDLGGRRVLVTNVGGEHYVFASQCPHGATDLDDADLVGTRLRCHGHSYWFELTSGECVMPRGGPTLATLPVEERDGEICVRLEW